MPDKSPYTRFDKQSLTLRDVLAVDRTMVANERTFLGYVRTTLALLAAGGSLLHFVTALWATIVGLLLLGACVPLFALGLHRYVTRRRALAPLVAGGFQSEPGAAPSKEAGVTPLPVNPRRGRPPSPAVSAPK